MRGSDSYVKTILTYANDGGGSKQVQAVTRYDDEVWLKEDFTYDQYGNITNKRSTATR